MFVSRIIAAAGGILSMASPFSLPVSEGSSGPPPLRDLHQVLNTLRKSPSPSPSLRAFRLMPFSSVSLPIRSKRRVRRGRQTIDSNYPTTPLPDSASQLSLAAGPPVTNRTLSVHTIPESILFSVANYDGPKDLAPSDNRRSLALYRADGPHDLAVYNRPSSLALYTAPIQYVRFWVDPRLHQVVLHIHSPRFTDGTPMFGGYMHLDPRNFEKLMFENTTFDYSISALREAFDEAGSQTEKASHILVGLHTFGALVSLVCIVIEKYLESQPVQDTMRSVDYLMHSGCATLRQVENQVSLRKEMVATACVADGWWNGVDLETETFDFTIAYFDTSLSQSTPSFDLPLSTPMTNQPTLAPAPAPVPSRRAPKKLALAQRPGGPRFKSAAWNRFRAK